MTAVRIIFLVVIAALVVWTPVAPAAPAEPASNGYSLRFFGNGPNDIDRVKIPLGNPARPVDIGQTDFTIEFWLKTSASTGGSCAPGTNGAGWINGHIVIDRDVFNNGDHGDYGISLANGRVCFGIDRQGTGRTIQGSSDVADGQWHHIAVTRNAANGQMRIYVDGQQEASANGPTGDVSYRNGRQTSYPNDPFLVFGAEKHDYPGVLHYAGLLDDIRISNNIRYASNFTRPSAPHTADANTMALYRFDEGNGATIGDSAPGGASPGFMNIGGSPAGPQWSLDTPFGPPPQLDPRAYLPMILR